MRYLSLISSLLLLLTSASIVKAYSLYQQAPFSNDIQIQQLEDELYQALNSFLEPQDPEDATKNCDSCISVLKLAKRFCYFPERIQLAVFKNICKRSKQVDNEVCEGLIDEQGSVMRKVLWTMDISGRDGHLACAAAANACPYPDVMPYNVTFPKDKPKHPKISKPSNQTISVLHLSDWHLDPQYEEGTETQCGKPICCRREYTNIESITQKASPWGSFGCDSPLTLIESMLEYIPLATPNTSFAILTGDVPPHEVWETLPTEKTQLIHDMSFALLHAHFDTSFLINTKLYPTIGNHESAPTNLFPLNTSSIPNGKKHKHLGMAWLYDALEENWKGWIDEKQLPSVHENSGSYISYPVPGRLKLISINTNFYYSLNWWLYQNPTQRDPNGILAWLIGHLQQSEDAEEKVWIIGHMPPGDASCFHDYANYYHQIIERYAPHVIAGQFFGHTHRDEIQLFYKGDSQEAKDAISIAYIGPSITPFPSLNPGFRTYSVDTGTFEVVDTHTFIADLDKSTKWDRVPNWHKEYSALDLYQTSNNDYRPLSPAWWHQVTEEMELNDDLFNLYWSNRFKQSPMTPDCAEEACRINTICTMRAGRSQDRCDYEPTYPPSSSNDKSGPVILDYKDEEACGIQLLAKKYR